MLVAEVGERENVPVAAARGRMSRKAVPYIFTMMHKTTLVVDDKKLAKVRRLLGTKGIRDTFDRALDEVIALDARRRVIERMRTMEGLDERVLRNARKEAWR